MSGRNRSPNVSYNTAIQSKEGNTLQVTALYFFKQDSLIMHFIAETSSVTDHMKADRWRIVLFQATKSQKCYR